MNTNDPILSIILVNSDGAEDTIACIASIMLHPPALPFEIVLVDNCSRIDCLGPVQTRFPEVHCVRAPARQGFAKNYNLGIRNASGEYLLVLNNDTLIPEGALDQLVEAARNNPAWGMVGPTLISPDGSIQSVCARELPSLASYLWTMLVIESLPPLLRLRECIMQARLARHPGGPVTCISGACMLVRRSALERAGMLDEGFDFYFEDIEWCHRFQTTGLVVAYVPKARIIHLGDQSLSRVKVWAKQSELRSALRYYQRYGGLSRLKAKLLWKATAASYLVRGLGSLGLELSTEQAGHGRAYLYLWWWVLQPAVRTLVSHATYPPAEEIDRYTNEMSNNQRTSSAAARKDGLALD